MSETNPFANANLTSTTPSTESEPQEIESTDGPGESIPTPSTEITNPATSGSNPTILTGITGGTGDSASTPSAGVANPLDTSFLYGNTGGTGAIGTPDTFPASKITDPTPGTLDLLAPNKDGCVTYDNDGEILGVMIGGTGGTGRIPDNIEDAKDQGQTPITIAATLKVTLASMDKNQIEAQLFDTLRRNEPPIAKAQTFIATAGLMVGIIANALKNKIISENYSSRAWTEYRRKNLDKIIHPNTLAVYMNIANINNVANYLSLGIDRLGKLAVFILNTGMASDPDPISLIVKNVDDAIMSRCLDYSFAKKCEAANNNYKLKKNGLDNITMDDILIAMTNGLEFDKKDITNMLEMKANNENYSEYITNPDVYKKATEQKQTGTSNNRKNNVKDVNSEIQKLTQTVSEAMAIDPSKINLDVERLDALIVILNNLRATSTVKNTESQND